MAPRDPPLRRHLPPLGEATSDRLLEGFLTYASELGLELYPSQEEAILEIFDGKSVILNTPTGSGKSLVAAAMHFKALAEDRVSFYTAPIKALVSEKFFALCRQFGPDDVGMMTGDATVNADAPIICCTAEILMNLSLRQGAGADVGYVIMDEFHYYADRDRGVAWQVPLLVLNKSRFLLMSATFGDTSPFERAIEDLTGGAPAVVRSAERPVPLDFTYRETPLQQTVEDLFEAGRAPIYIVHFTQRSAAEQAQNLMSLDFLPKDKKRELRHELGQVRWTSPYGKDLRRHLGHGIGVHHAGMLPKYRRVVERLAQDGYLKVICGTDTLGVGVNIPIRTVLFTRLCKYDGEKTRVLTVRDFKQIAGRAGRKGFDEEGSVVAQAPEHAIENKTLREKAAGDAKKMRKTVFKKPPTKGYAHWDESTFKRLVAAEPEALTSSFQITHGMMLNVLTREREGCQALKKLIRGCHEGPTSKHQIALSSMSMFRSLVEADIVELVPKETGAGKKPQVHADLQSDFSLNQTLSLYVVEVVSELDSETPEYAVDVLSLVESILENPGLILKRQLDKLKDQVIAELKESGVEYEDRMKELDRLEHPKPNADFIYATFNEFARHHPWVGAENIRPKSVAREMFESGQTFNEYVKEYGLHRSEGLLLRYLSDAYKALVQNVPEAAKTDEVHDVTEWLGAVVRSIDSSLLDEWERLRDPEHYAERTAAEPKPATSSEPLDITKDTKSFTVLVRNAAFRVVTALARRSFERAAKEVEPVREDEPWTADRIAEAIAPYFAEHGSIRTDPVARGPGNTLIDKDPMLDESSGEPAEAWRVQQRLVDPDEHGDWYLDLLVDLARSREEDRPVLKLRSITT